MVKKALAVAALLMLTSCGVSEVDIPVVEESIVDGVKEDLDLEVTADCPDQVDWETGETFSCDVEGVEGFPTAEVTMKDDDGNVAWELIPAE